MTEKSKNSQRFLATDYENLLKEIDKLIPNEQMNKDIKKLLLDTINQLIYIYYITLAIDPAKMEELIDIHEPKCEIAITTYMNLGILYSQLCKIYLSESYKDHCLKYCKITSQNSSIYGESRVLNY